MLPTDPKAAVEYFIATINQEDWQDHLDQFFAEQEWWDEWWTAHRAFRHAFPDYQYSVDYIAADGEIVCLSGTAEGTHTAEFPFAELKGIAPTGKKCSWGEAWWMRMVNGKPMEGGLTVDGVSRLQQLGVLPQPDEE